MDIGDWTERFKGTANLPMQVRRRLLEHAHVISLPAGKTVFSPSSIPDSLLFLVEGTIRVSQTSESGRDIVLYRVEAGESCVLTTACMMVEEAYNAEGITESAVTAVALPRASFDQMVSQEPDFRNFVFAAYSRRLLDLLHVVEDVAFGRIDMRLAQRLIALSHGNKDISATHQQLASELGTAREVISRVLQDFSKRGLISQTRGHIKLVDKQALGRIAENS